MASNEKIVTITLYHELTKVNFFIISHRLNLVTQTLYDFWTTTGILSYCESFVTPKYIKF